MVIDKAPPAYKEITSFGNRSREGVLACLWKSDHLPGTILSKRKETDLVYEEDAGEECSGRTKALRSVR